MKEEKTNLFHHLRQKHTVEHSQAINEVILAAGVTQKEMSVSGPLASFTPYD